MIHPDRAGRFVTQQSGPEGFRAFIPAPLPPDPAIVFDGALQQALESANRALGRLDSLGRLLPSPDLFLYTYVRKEAVLSSQIEGTQSSLSDLLRYENLDAPGIPEAEAREVSNYVAALEHGLARLRSGFPLSLRLVREIHARLLEGTRGGHQAPGEFRRSQNWIGGSRPGNAVYVPPPVDHLAPALDNLERFLHNQPLPTPTLLKAGLAHAQFETIHPFLDGNGRLGRLLITLLLCAEGALRQPLLYLSVYFKRHRGAYYDSLQRIRSDGDWEQWLLFFLHGVDDVATGASETSGALLVLFAADRRAIQERFGRQAASALRVHGLLCERAIISIPRAAAALGLTQPTITAALQRMEESGIVREVTHRRRNRQFCYEKYLGVLEAEPSAASGATPPATSGTTP